ncbi:MAG TPA: lipoyl(octanoyl) transferase LipB [Bacteroidales bacterium]|nr:lipoyl(octanoyl) transferase LipB [Bacteroidales bacterium]
MHKDVVFIDLGSISYKEAWDYQEQLFNEIINSKLSNDNEKTAPDYLIFCEHFHVFTLGKNGSERNLLVNQMFLKNKQVEFVKTNRGGDITYHGPGQIVGYPILNLEKYVKGVKQYIYLIEESIIDCLKLYNIKGERLEGATGVWLDVQNKNLTRKICAIGVRTSHWVSMHGFAFNVNTDLEYFNMINPCGFVDKKVTSLEKELGEKLNIEDVKINLLNSIANNFKMNIIYNK